MLFEEIKNIKSDKAELNKFGKTIGVVLILVGVLLFIFSKSSYIYFICTGLMLIALGYLLPQVLKPVQKIWMGFSVILGWLSTRIILSILFYLVFTSIKLLALLFGKKFLQLKIDKNTNTYWNYRERKVFKPEDYERQF